MTKREMTTRRQDKRKEEEIQETKKKSGNAMIKHRAKRKKIHNKSTKIRKEKRSKSKYDEKNDNK